MRVKTLASWYRDHLGPRVGDGGWAVLRWREHDDPARLGTTAWAVLDGDRVELWQPSEGR